MLLDIQKFYSVVVEELPTNVVDLLLTGFGLDCFLEKVNPFFFCLKTYLS
ncbi:hypothetical protein LguiA_025970 [Lonicera macranthoides]